jgi:uncharacterized repeat protein (TIGR03803 family)
MLLTGLLGGAGQAHASTLTTLSQFPGGGDGAAPYGGLASLGGNLYGTTYAGGTYGRGTVYSINPSTGAETIVYSFNAPPDATDPESGVLATGGLLYGVSNSGGANGYGAVYSVNPSTGAEKVVFSFTSAMGGESGSNLVTSGGYLYGTTFGGGNGAGYGTVFKIDIATGAEKTLYSFTGGADGGSPQYGVTYVKGMLYGTTTFGGSAGAGTIFAVNATSGAETTLLSFNGASLGGGSYGGVIDVNGILYNTTAYGGSSGVGTIDAYDIKTGVATTVYNFTGGADGTSPNSPLYFKNGILYGTAYSGGAAGFGTVFGVTAATGKETTLYSFTGGANGGHSVTPLIQIGSALYGTDEGPNDTSPNNGTVFKIVLATGAETTLHNFQGNPDVYQQNSGLLNDSGTLFGSTTVGGTNMCGTLYALFGITAQPSFVSLACGAAGGLPVGDLISLNGYAYGVDVAGGANGSGLLFSFNETSYSAGPDASFPAGTTPNGPLLAYKTLIYGTTKTGGTNGSGTVFVYYPSTNTLSTLYNFTGGSDGGFPFAGLIESGGYLYGTTAYGGANNVGTIFRINPKTGAEAGLYSFTGGSDGTYPFAPLVALGGVLFGTTNYGGTNSADCYGGFGCGILFSFNPTGNVFTILHSFTYQDGALPAAGLLASGSTLYGSTEVGGTGNALGTVFSYTTKTAAFKTLYNFQGGADGGFPVSPMINISGTLYGTTNAGGTYNTGTIFSLKP